MTTAREQAMNFLAQREHSAAELRRKLRVKGHEAEEIEKALTLLMQDRLQSDERFAEQFTQMRCRQGYGPRRVALELEQRGISEELISSYVWSDSQQWRDTLESLVTKRYRSQEAADKKEQAKRIRFLMQRGFDFDAIKQYLGSDW